MTFTMNGVGRRAIFALRKGLVPIVLATVVFCLVQLAMDYGVERAIYSGMGEAFVQDRGFGLLGYVVIGLSHLLRAMHTAAISEIAIRTNIGKPVRPGQIMRGALVNGVPVLIFIVVFSVGCLLCGTVLLVPGLFFATVFSIVVPVFVAERGNVVGTFKRSFHLTEGHRWQIFSLWLVLGVVVYLLSHAISGLAPLSELRSLFPQLFPEGWLEDGEPLLHYDYDDPLVGSLFKAVTAIVIALRVVLNTAIYLSLRVEKDASAEANLAQVFE